MDSAMDQTRENDTTETTAGLSEKRRGTDSDRRLKGRRLAGVLKSEAVREL
jgi:hypothetical protein